MKDAIGVIGGMGPRASQLFYKMITEHTAAECDQDHVPLLILSDVTMPDRTGAILDGKYDAPYNRLMEDAKFLEEYGCTAVVVTCNTAHFFMDMIEHELRIPFISMIRESAKEVAGLHPGSVVAVLATDGTVKAGLYQRALEAEDLIPWVPDADIQKDWCKIATDFNEKIKNYGKKCGLTSGVGTTVTAILITEKRYYIIDDKENFYKVCRGY